MKQCSVILVWLAITAASFLPSIACGAVAPNVSSVGSITERVATPVRVASDLLGNFYLSDPRAGGILKYSSQGRFLGQLPTAGTPQGIAVTAGGDLVVGEGTFVAVLSASGAERFRLGRGEGQFKMANGIALDQTGRIYVVDSLDNCVQVFAADGTPLSVARASAGKPFNSFGTTGKAAGQLFQPTGIAFEAQSGTLAVADTLNSRVQFFGTDGTPVRTVGSLGTGSGKFTSPQGVSFSYGSAGPLMYVVDTFQSNIQVIDLSTAAFLRVIGSYGTGSGKLIAPSDAVFDSFDPNNTRLVVANGAGNLALFGVDLPAPSSTGPQLTVDPLPLATNLTQLTLKGTVASGATVQIAGGAGAVLGPVTMPTATSWSATVSGLLAGTNIFTVTATDAAARTSSVTATVMVLPAAPGLPLTALTVDPVPPLVPTRLLTIHGTVDSGSTVVVNGNPATVTGTTWSYQATLSEGANSLLITASHASSSDATTGVSVVLDSDPPTLQVSMLPSGSTTSTQRFPITGTVSDTSATTVQLVVNGGSPVTVPVVAGSFSTVAILEQGANIVGVTAVDVGGNLSPTAIANITLVPSAPTVRFTTPDGITVATDTVSVSGAVTPGSTVTVNGQPVTVSAGNFSTTVNLTPGLNTVVATATLGGASSSAKLGVTLNPAAPPLAVALPGTNAVVLGGPAQQLAVNGSAPAGSTVSATVNGNPVPVVANPDGSFGVGFSVPTGSFGTFTVAITAVDPAGNQTTSVRELTVADPTPPQVTVESANPPKVSVGGGAILSVRDKNGPVGTVTVYGGVASVDLTGVQYDPATLNITAISPAGASSRNGVLVPATTPGQTWSSGTPTIVDALESLKIASGQKPAGFQQLLHGDVGPLVNGIPTPDGKIDLQDTMATMMRVLGLW